MTGPINEDGRSQRERMLAGDLYNADDSELKEDGRRTMRLVEQYNKTSIDEPKERVRILTELLGSVGADVEIRPPFHCDYGAHIRIGARTFVNFNLTALDRSLPVTCHRTSSPSATRPA